MPIDLGGLVADPGYAPREWQSGAPRDSFGWRPPVGNSPDLERVLALPRREQELDGTERAETIVDLMTERFARVNHTCKCVEINPERHAAEGCITRLRLVQALALREICMVGGLLGPIGVGHGKTLIDLLAPLAFAWHAGTQTGDSALCVLLVPPGLVTQLLADIEYCGEHFSMPSVVVQGGPSRVRTGVPRLSVMPYSRLSRKDATSWLTLVKPDAIIADECHKLRDRNTATTSRVMRFFDEHRDTKFAGWSGSITSKTIRDYAHLSALALKAGSPLPRAYETVEEWAKAIDPSPMPADPGALLEGLIATGCCAPGESLHDGIRRRICETIGVVTTTAPAVDCVLEIVERTGVVVPSIITAAIAGALDFVRPDGEELITAMQTVACAIELACGFHYRWIYPKHSFPRDEQLVLDWLNRRKEWHKELREQLKSRAEHMDSPELCEFAAQRHLGLRPSQKKLPNWEAATYSAWLDVKSKVKYQTEAVWLDDFLVKDATEWIHEHRGIVWYAHSAFGERLAKHSKAPYYAGGKYAAQAVVEERGDRSIIASIKAHGTGRNGLQFAFADQLFGSSPADPAQWEQTLGRLHRAGQRASVVHAEFYLHTESLKAHVTSALRAALYVQGTMGSAQKLRTGMKL